MKAGIEEFNARFNQMRRGQKIAFVQQNKPRIAELRNPDILYALCAQGFFNALLPLIKTGDARADEQIIDFYAPGSTRMILTPSKSDEREIVKYAATRLEVVKFLREQTVILSGLGRKRVPISHILYEYATPEVADYLFGWICQNKLLLMPVSGLYLFSKASANVIHDYVVKVGCLSSNMCVSYSMLKGLALRQDIDAEDKHELLLLTANRMRVSTQSIHRLRQEGLLDF